MKFRLNKLMAGLVMAGGALALVGCGGDAPALGAASNLTAAVSATNQTAINTARTVIAATGDAGANFAVNTAIPFNSVSGGGTPPVIPAGSVLNLNPTTASGAIADFKITAPNTSKAVEGVVEPGSCNFRVTGPVNTAQLLDGYVVGQIYTIGTCRFTIPSSGALVNAPVSLTPTLTLGDVVIPANTTITITIQDNGSVTAQVPTVVNGVTTFTTVTVAPPGSVSLTTGGAPA